MSIATNGDLPDAPATIAKVRARIEDPPERSRANLGGARDRLAVFHQRPVGEIDCDQALARLAVYVVLGVGAAELDNARIFQEDVVNLHGIALDRARTARCITVDTETHLDSIYTRLVMSGRTDSSEVRTAARRSLARSYLDRLDRVLQRR